MLPGVGSETVSDDAERGVLPTTMVVACGGLERELPSAAPLSPCRCVVRLPSEWGPGESLLKINFHFQSVSYIWYIILARREFSYRSKLGC